MPFVPFHFPYTVFLSWFAWLFNWNQLHLLESMCAFIFFQMGQLLMKNSSIFRMLCDIAIFGSRKQKFNAMFKLFKNKWAFTWHDRFTNVCGLKNTDGHKEWMGTCKKQLILLEFATFWPCKCTLLLVSISSLLMYLHVSLQCLNNSLSNGNDMLRRE